MPLEPEDLAQVVEQINSGLNVLQEHYGRERIDGARIRFPRRFIREAYRLRQTLPDIGTDVQRRNAALTLMTLDVLRWVIIRTDLRGAVLSMVVKQALFLLGSVCEWLTAASVEGKKFKVRTSRLVERGTISNVLKVDLDWLWDRRNDAHFLLVGELEHERYTVDDVNRAQAAFVALRDALRQ